MASRQPARSYGQLAILFGIAFAILAAILELLDYFGVPADILGTAVCGVGLAALAAIGIYAGTMQTSEFYLAARAVPAAGNGAASAVSVISGTLFIGLAGTYFAGADKAVAATIGWCFGFVVLTVGLAPYFRKSGAFGVVDFLGLRYGGHAVRLAAAVVVAVALFPATAAAFALAAEIAANLLGLPASSALAIVAAVVMATTVLGGLRAITRTAIAEYIVVASAIVVPVTVVAFREYHSPVPQLSFGLALHDAALLALAGGRDIATFRTSSAWSWIGGGAFNSLATVAVLTAGVAALPQLLMRSAAVRGPATARRSAAWGLLLLLIVVSAAPAYAAFARYLILRDVVDVPIEHLPDWIFTFGHLGLVRICGIEATSVNALLGACSNHPGFTGNLAASDLSVADDAVVLAAPGIFNLPDVITALVALGALAAALAAGKAMAFAIASAFGHDLYRGMSEVAPSAGRQLIVTRLALVLVTALAAWFAGRHPDDAIALAPGAIAMAAGGLFPALILAVWWKPATAPGALGAIIGGGAVTAALVLHSRYPGFLPVGDLHLTEITAGIVGLPVGIVAAVALSLGFSPSGENRMAVVDAIRRPGGTPIVQESESL
jgi:cation/acetate symporter